MAWYNMGTTFYKLERYDEALEVCNKAISINQKDEMAWKVKADALFKLGEYDNSIRSYDEAISIDSNYTCEIIGRKETIELLKKEIPKSPILTVAS